MIRHIRKWLNKMHHEDSELCDKCYRILGTGYKDIKGYHLPVWICKCGFWRAEAGGWKLILKEKYLTF